MDMNIKNILLVGIIATVLFGAITLGYAYTKAGSLQTMIAGLGSMTGGAVDLPPTYQLAAVEWYLLVGAACFTTIGAALSQLLATAGP